MTKTFCVKNLLVFDKEIRICIINIINIKTMLLLYTITHNTTAIHICTPTYILYSPTWFTYTILYLNDLHTHLCICLYIDLYRNEWSQKCTGKFFPWIFNYHDTKIYPYKSSIWYNLVNKLATWSRCSTKCTT